MKKITAVFLLSTAAPALADDNGWYAGVDVGSASVEAVVTNAAYSSTKNTVAGLQLGYQYNKHWSAELFYTGCGKFVYDLSGNTATGTSSAWGVRAAGSIPLSDSFSVYARLGIAMSSTSLDNSLSTATVKGQSRTAATYGLGLQYDVTPAVGLRAGVDVYSLGLADAGGVLGSTNNYNSTVTSLGAVFKF